MTQEGQDEVRRARCSKNEGQGTTSRKGKKKQKVPDQNGQKKQGRRRRKR